MEEQKEKSGRTIVEVIEVAGNQLVERVKELAQEAKVRQLKIVADDGDVFFETPLNIGLVVGGVVVLAAPWLAILGTIAALATKVRIEIERDADDDDNDTQEITAEADKDVA
ncbi:MAG: DUF4342 domain-containing protein [Hyphomicrobiales bacterium]|nr:DUF4342 domain-containing protein [Hyphomicrobiales bacterium]